MITELEENRLKIRRSVRDKRKVCISITTDFKNDRITLNEHISISKLKKFLEGLK